MSDKPTSLAALELLQRRGIVIKHLLDLHAQPLKHDRSGQARGAARRSEAHLLPAQIFDRVYLGARQHVHFRNRQADNVVDPVLEIGNFSLGAEIVEHVGLGDGDIDLAQVEQVVEVGSSAVSDDGDDAQVLTVVEDFRHLVGKGHVGAGQLPAGNADRPVVLAGSHCRVAAALFERFRHRLRVCVREEFERAKRECESQNCQQTHCAAR